jgi:hypothetical protein
MTQQGTDYEAQIAQRRSLAPSYSGRWFSQEELENRSFWEAHRDEILRANAAGAIVATNADLAALNAAGKE